MDFKKFSKTAKNSTPWKHALRVKINDFDFYGIVDIQITKPLSFYSIIIDEIWMKEGWNVNLKLAIEDS